MGCDKLLTTPPLLGDRFDQAMRGLDNGELGDFQDGQIQFRKSFTITEGLGPIFNNVSCASCHSGDGRGTTQNILVRFSRGTDLVPGEGGPQIQDRAIPGAVAEHLPAGVDVSLRMPPPVFGAGFIEAITDSSILSHADPSDADGDGISGRANMVTAPSYVPAGQPGGGPGTHVGRFGRKAQLSSLFQQTVTAYSQDIGITSDALPVENVNPLAPPGLPNPDRARDPEVSGQQVNDVMQYMRMLNVPAPGDWTDQRRQGQTLFTNAQCAKCHIPVMHAGPHDIDAVANRDVTIYSDLLLHDLGDALADNRPDGDADGHEWRTAPLWGTRIAKEFTNGTLLLMHDGRAHSVDEAIRLHGGEATAAVNSFLAMTPDERAALIDFVESR